MVLWTCNWVDKWRVNFLLLLLLLFYQKMEMLESTANLQFIFIGLILQYIAKYPHCWNRYFKTSDFWSIWLNFGSSTLSFQIRKEKRSFSIVYLFILVRRRVVSLTRIRTTQSLHEVFSCLFPTFPRTFMLKKNSWCLIHIW